MKTLPRQAFFGLAALLPNLMTSSAQTTYTTGSSNDIQFQWGVPEAAVRSGSGNVYFQLNAADSYTWVGLGIGSGMTGADIFIIYQDGDGNLTLSTRDGAGEVMPEYKERPDVELIEGSGVINGRMIANVVCGSCSDRLDLAGSNEWIAAWQSGDALNSANPAEIITIHDGEAEFHVDFAQAAIASDINPFSNSNGTIENSSDESNATGQGGPDYDTILLAHGVIMTIVFVGLYPLGALLIPLVRNWLIHASVQMLAFLLMWVGFALGYVYAEYDGYLWQTHPLLGAIVIAALGIQPVFGWLHHRSFIKHRKRGPISYLHVWYGRALLVIGVINGGLGLEMSGKTSGTYMIAYCTVAAVIYLVYLGSIGFGWFRSRKSSQGQVIEKTTSGGESSVHG